MQDEKGDAGEPSYNEPPLSRYSKEDHPEWELIDLRDHYDQDLLLRFYQEYMIPNFPLEDELDPLETFLLAFKEEYGYDFHILLVLDRDSVQRGDPATRYKYAQILGGLVFEYHYNLLNVALLTYLLVHRSQRGKGMAAYMVSKAVEILDRNAKERGHFAGCDAIFLETNSAKKITPAQDVMDPRRRHAALAKMGFRLVDIDYVQKPLSAGQNKCKDLLLTVLITPRIPRDGNQYYIPSSIVRDFQYAQWRIAEQAGHLDVPLEEDEDFKRMIEQIEARDKIPVLDLPWGGGREWTLVDMFDDYDLELLVQFYRLFMMSEEEDSEPLENWLRALAPGQKEQAPHIADLHVVMALDMRSGTAEIVGGVVFEYYTVTNCGLIGHLFVKEGYRRQGMGKMLFHTVVDILDRNAKSRGRLAGCNAVFMEADLDPQRHKFLYSNGFRLLDFEYWRPPYSLTDNSRQYLLTLLLTPRILQSQKNYNPDTGEPEGDLCFPANVLKTFYSVIWRNAADWGYCTNFAKHPAYLKVMEQLEGKEEVALLKLPWHTAVTAVGERVAGSSSHSGDEEMEVVPYDKPSHKKSKDLVKKNGTPSLEPPLPSVKKPNDRGLAAVGGWESSTMKKMNSTRNVTSSSSGSVRRAKL